MKQSEYPIPAKMPHVEKDGTFARRCNWTAVAREYAQRIKRILRESGSDNEFDLSDAMIKRRIRAVTDYTDRIIERYQAVPGYEPERKDETGESWIYLNFIPSTTCNIIEKHMYLLFAASIWILDEILLPGDLDKRKKLFRILPKDEREIDDLFNMPDCWHPCYEYELILSVMHVLYYRNRDIAEMETDDADIDRVMMSSLHANGAQHADTPSRRAFDELMALIPEESVRRAAAYFEELFWLWTDRYFDCMIPIDEAFRASRDRVNGIADQYNSVRSEMRDALVDLTENRKRKNQKPKSPIYNPLLMNPVSATGNPFEMFATGASPLRAGIPGMPFPDPDPDDAFQQVLNMADRLDALARQVDDEMECLHENETRKRSFGMDIQRLGYIQHEECLRDYGEDVAERMKPIRIVQPFEACFGLLWLIENDSDLPWLYGSCCGLMSEVAESLPWGVFGYKEWQDPVWDPEDEGYEENLRLTAEKPSTIPEWYERSYAPKKGELFSFNRSMGQILYEETGCLMPRDIHKYDGRQKMIRKYGVPAKDTNSLLLLFTALAHARRGDRALNFEEDILQFWDEMDQENAAGGEKTGKTKPADRPPTNQELTERLKILQEENKRLRISLHEAERASREARKDLASVRENAEMDHRELADLRELVFNLDNEKETEETGEIDESCFPYEVRRETVVFGGHDSWLKAIRQMLTGNIRFIDRDLVFDIHVVRNADIIWIQPNAISHSQYYRIVDAARQYRKPVRYFSCASAARGAAQLMASDK